MKIIEKEFNAETGNETLIEREETPQEIKAREKDIAQFAELQTKIQAKSAARQQIFERLGLTAEEAAILLS
jgi:hypothetical protein